MQHILFYPSSSDEQIRLDVKYTSTMLLSSNFLDYLLQNNASVHHASEIQDHPGLNGLGITTIMNEFHEHKNSNISALTDAWNNDKFFIIMDEWENAWVYVGNDDSFFKNWLEQDQEEHGTTAFQFFEQIYSEQVQATG
jgi:hypothetical protein